MSRLNRCPDLFDSSNPDTIPTMPDFALLLILKIPPYTVGVAHCVELRHMTGSEQTTDVALVKQLNHLGLIGRSVL